LTASLETKRTWIEPSHTLPIIRQCEIIALPRSSYYYEPRIGETEENLLVMREIDRIYTAKPFFGVPRITRALHERGMQVNHKRVARLMGVMGIAAVVPGPHTSRAHPSHPVYPYLLRGRKITRPDEVWCADITYAPMNPGFLYLMAILDWYSRYVLAWTLSNTLDVGFCIDALAEALLIAKPEIFNTDQGAQFTSDPWLSMLLSRQIRISMDGRGRALDNVFVERLWRTVKYEDIYLRDYGNGRELHEGLTAYFQYYNAERKHSALEYRTPLEVYSA
jgi:putative transposase